MIATEKEGRTIDVAKAIRLRLFRMMKAARPVDRNVALVPRQSRGTLCSLGSAGGHRRRSRTLTHRASGGDGAVLEEAVKDRAIVSEIVCADGLADGPTCFQ